MTRGKQRAEGQLPWPDGAGHDGATYAAERLVHLESTFEPGCPRQPLAPLQLFARASGVSSIDAHPAEVAAIQQRLIEALRTGAAAACTSEP